MKAAIDQLHGLQPEAWGMVVWAGPGYGSHLDQVVGLDAATHQLFEPHPALHDRLARRLRGRDTVELVQQPVSRAPGRRDFHLMSDPLRSGLRDPADVLRARPNLRRLDTLPLAVVTLDAIAARLDIALPNLLVLDDTGIEAELLGPEAGDALAAFSHLLVASEGHSGKPGDDDAVPVPDGFTLAPTPATASAPAWRLYVRSAAPTVRRGVADLEQENAELSLQAETLQRELEQQQALVAELESGAGAREQRLLELKVELREARAVAEEKALQLDAQASRLEDQATQLEEQARQLEAQAAEGAAARQELQQWFDHVNAEHTAAQETAIARQSRIDELEAALQARDAQGAEIQAALAARNGQLAETQAALAARDGQLAETQAALTARDGQLAETQAALAARDGQLAESQAALAARDGQLAETRAALSARNAQLDDMQATLSSRDAELVQAHAELARLQQRVAEMQERLQSQQARITELQQSFAQRANRYEAQLAEAAQTARLASRMQAVRDQDLRDLQQRYEDSRRMQDQQHALLARIGERLGSAAAHFHQLADQRDTPPPGPETAQAYVVEGEVVPTPPPAKPRKAPARKKSKPRKKAARPRSPAST